MLLYWRADPRWISAVIFGLVHCILLLKTATLLKDSPYAFGGVCLNCVGGCSLPFQMRYFLLGVLRSKHLSFKLGYIFLLCLKLIID